MIVLKVGSYHSRNSLILLLLCTTLSLGVHLKITKFKLVPGVPNQRAGRLCNVFRLKRVFVCSGLQSKYLLNTSKGTQRVQLKITGTSYVHSKRWPLNSCFLGISLISKRIIRQNSFVKS